MIGLDFETSGHDKKHPCLPIEVGVVRLDHAGNIKVVADHLIKGAKWITRHAYRTHGIRVRDTWRGIAIEQLQELMESFKDEEVCVHAHGTEKRILRESFGITGINWVDTLTLSRKLNTDCPNHQLATVTRHLGLEARLKSQMPNSKWHRAAFDAGASLLIADHFAKNKNRSQDQFPSL